MATEQKTRSSAKSWQQVFPQEINTQTASALFVKKLLVVSVSNLTYLRAILPEEAYSDRVLQDLRLKILRDDSPCKTATNLTKWLKGAFDALDKKYLRVLILAILPDVSDSQKAIETYTFRFTYSNNGTKFEISDSKSSVSIGGSDWKDIKQSTLKLLRILIIMSTTLKTLPDSIALTMKLYYYDEVTPPDYEPPCFHAADSSDFVFDLKSTDYNIGKVATDYHSLRLTVKTSYFDHEAENFQEQGEDMEVVLDSQEQKDNCPVEPTVTESQDIINESLQNVDEQLENLESQPEKSLSENSSSEKVVEEEFPFNCICEYNKEQDDGAMWICDICENWSHAVCYGFLSEEEVPVRPICKFCGDPSDPNKIPTVIAFNNIESNQLKKDCMWRKALMFCINQQRMVASKLSSRLSIDLDNANDIIQRMESEGVLKKSASKNKKLGKLVDKGKIEKEMFPKYFTKLHLSSRETEVDNITAQTEMISLSNIDTGKKRSIPPIISEIEDRNSVISSAYVTDFSEARRKRSKCSITAGDST